MPVSEPEPIFGELADRLRAAADELTDQWIERLGDRLGVRPRRLLPTDELRDHVPVVIRGAADYLEVPTASPPNQSIDILRTLAQLRREQGYDVQEILSEVDILSELVFERFAGWTDDMDDLQPGAAMRVAARLSAILRSIASIAVGTYREEELRQGREVAERLRDFAGMLRHELMNPLSTAGISAELLTQEGIANDPEQRQKHAARIRDRLERMHHLVDDVAALAIAEGARAEPRWISVRNVVETVTAEVRPTAERLGVELRVEMPEEDFEVDAVRVEIALMNLLTNGIKFSDPNKDPRWVRVRFGPAESEGLRGGRRISVEDNGRGIHPEAHNKVFQRFFRAHPDVEGTGLGLEIAKRVVEQRGGQLWFESEPGVGSTFFIEIPQRISREEQQPGDVER